MIGLVSTALPFGAVIDAFVYAYLAFITCHIWGRLVYQTEDRLDWDVA